MSFCNWDRTIRDLNRYGIVGIGLVSLAITAVIVNIPQSVLAQNRHLTARSAELPIVRSTALDPGIDVPWSQPVKIIDPFEGEYVGVFDKNYFYKRILNTNARVQVVSLWRNDSVRFLLAYSDRDCGIGYGFFDSPFSNNCLTANAALGIASMYIKVGDRVFQLEGENSRFRVDRDLAAVLKNSPSENISIRLVTESGEAVDSKIGKGTVQAWKAIY